MEVVLERARSRLTDPIRTVVTGNVHNQDKPIQRWLKRTGFEPVGLPTKSYQDWVLRLDR